MPNTIEGGKKLRATMIKKYGSEEAWKAVMKARAVEGGIKSRGGGFGHKDGDPRSAGIKGGYRSRRGHKFLYEKDGYNYYIKKSTGEEVKHKAQG